MVRIMLFVKKDCILRRSLTSPMQCSQNRKRLHSHYRLPDVRASEEGNRGSRKKERGGLAMRAMYFALLIVMVIGTPGNAQADLIFYLGSNNNGIQITDLGNGVTVNAWDTSLPEGVFSGNGTGTFGSSIIGNPELFVGDTVTAFSTINGTGMESTATTFGGGLLTFSNFGRSTSTFSFAASWNIMLDTTPASQVTSPDFAFSQANIFLLDSNFNSLLDPGTDFFESHTITGGGQFTYNGFKDFTFTIDPGQSLTYDFGVLSNGQAFQIAAVPEPSSMILLGSAAVLGLCSRRAREKLFGKTKPT